MSAPDLAIVVVTHQSATSVPVCLDALGPRLLRSVTAVDNASTDGTRDVLARRGVTVLANRTNEGFGRAANRAARESGARDLCFLNPDCTLDHGAVDTALAVLASRPRVCVCPDLDEGDGQVIAGCQPGYSRLKLVDDMLRSNYGGHGVGPRLRGRAGYHDDRWAWPHGACFFVRREDFLAMGGFDERFFLYMEDVDFGRRFCAGGGTIVPLPSRVFHRCRSGSAIPAARRRRLLNRGRVRYARVHHGAVFAAVLASLALPATASAWRGGGR